jgi:diadenosine tetraphosphate (Ap4A) HIT family hydrolase
MTRNGSGDACPFCHLAPGRVSRSSTHARAFADAYPVTPGHTLVVPVRHVVSLFDFPADELADVWRLVGEVRAALAASHTPDAFNIGVNDGEAAACGSFGHRRLPLLPVRLTPPSPPSGVCGWTAFAPRPR